MRVPLDAASLPDLVAIRGTRRNQHSMAHHMMEENPNMHLQDEQPGPSGGHFPETRRV